MMITNDERREPRRLRRSKARTASTTTPNLALMAILTWFAATQSSSTTTLASAPILQSHRIAPSKRHVTYSTKEKTNFDKFWIPPSAAFSVENGDDRELRQISMDQWEIKHKSNRKNELNDDDDAAAVAATTATADASSTVWTSIVADAAVHSPDGTDRSLRADLVRQQTNGEKKRKKQDSKRRSLLRRLYDQFIITNSTDGVGNTTFESSETVNVTLSLPNGTEPSNGSTANGAAAQEEGEEETANSFIATEGSGVSGSTEQPHNSNNRDNSGDDPDATDTSAAPRFQPIRIRSMLAESSQSGTMLTNFQRNTLFQDLLSPALLAWSAALRVIPVQGNLTVDRFQLIDGRSCGPGVESGLPSVVVPPEHLTLGLPNTDIMIYLGLGFVDSGETQVPSQTITEAPSEQNSPSATPTSADSDSTGDENNPEGGSTSHGVRGSKSEGAGGKLITEEGGDLPSESHTQSEIITGAYEPLAGSPDEADTNSTAENLCLTPDSSGDCPPPEDNLTSISPTSSPTSKAYDGKCSGDYLAAASFCSTDQFDRPTAALLHICIDEEFFLPKNRNRNIRTLMHELGHALGFNALSMAHFRNPDGTPMTRRTNTGAVPEIRVECTGPSRRGRTRKEIPVQDKVADPTGAPSTTATTTAVPSSATTSANTAQQNNSLSVLVGYNETIDNEGEADGENVFLEGIPPEEEEEDHSDTSQDTNPPNSGRRWATVALPSEDILKFRFVRGGVRVAEIVTPSVMQVVRNQFDCQRLTGAELESGEALPLVSSSNEFENGCLGDHWERRLFSGDLMNPIVDDQQLSTRLSTLTLAYFADSGWYQVDLSRAVRAAGWGRGAGCGFVDDTCVGTDGRIPPQNAPFFCNQVPNDERRSNAQQIHGCTPDLSRKAVCSIGQYDADLIPPEYQYFQGTYGADVGGFDSYMDFCPVYTGFANGLCSSLESEAALKASPLERFGRRNSRCVLGNMQSGFDTALCMPIACVLEDQTFRIGINGIWHVCNHQDEEIFAGYQTTIKCPDPRRICPTFYCPYDCLGTGGFCDYESGKCMCEEDPDDDGKIVKFPCGEKPEDESDEAVNPAFYNMPGEQSRELGAKMPASDELGADYYVDNLAALEGTPQQNRTAKKWVLALISVVGISVVFVGVAFWAKRAQERYDNAWFRRDIPRPTEGNAPPTVNKDKMVATLLVDLRIRNRDDQLPEVSLADTDCQLTDSERDRSEFLSDSGSAPKSEGSLSLDPSMDGTIEEDVTKIGADPTGLADEAPIIRRRRAQSDRLLPVDSIEQNN